MNSELPQYSAFDGKFITYFGANGNIFLKDDCDQLSDRAGSFEFGSSFELPDGIQRNSKEAINYMGGGKTFRILEVETYLVKKL